MRVGVVTKWFNRGQPVVGRQLRSALDALGHETFVLARPKKERGPRPGALDRDDVWDQPGVTEASAYDVPAKEYERWVAENAIEAILCDQNYQFAELAELRRRGVLTIGRFVWEHFTAEHVAGAREAFDVVYSLTRAEQERYAEMGLETPYVPWGCHPELIEIGDEVRPAAAPAASGETGHASSSPAASSGHRKPLEAVLEAFEGTDDERLRLVVKAQVERKQVRPAAAAAGRDPRIELRLADQPTAEHLREFASCDVCLSPARWEGLGLPLYEAIAFGMPAITNDAPPMNEAIHDGDNGLLVASTPNGTAQVGDPRARPGRRRAAGARSSASPTTRCAPSWPRERLGCATPSAPGQRPSRASASCWKPGRTGSLEGFMGIAEQIDKYRKRLAIVRAGRRLRGRGPEPRPGAVRMRGDALGDDAAAADARLASGARDPRARPTGCRS